LPQGERPSRQQPGPVPASGEPAPQPGSSVNSPPATPVTLPATPVTPPATQATPPATRMTPPATRMTARGAVVAMFLLFLVGTLAAGWLHLEVLAGLSFVAGCAMAAYYSRRDALLTAVVTPPLVFMAALVIAELLTSHEDTVRHSLTAAAEGIVLTLAAVAPWLFSGVVIGLVIALMRGLPQCVRDLSAELRGDLGLRGPSAQRDPFVQRDPRGTGGGRS
jgi:Domain of unknown function (DUF6542)